MLDTEKVRIWKVVSSETDYISGLTLIHALKEYFSMTDISFVELDDSDEISEIPREKWGEYRIKLGEASEQEVSFNEYIHAQSANYGLLCSTAY